MNRLYVKVLFFYLLLNAIQSSFKLTPRVRISKKMASRIFRPLSGLAQITKNSSMHLHKNRKYVIENKKYFASEAPEQKPAASQDTCPNRTCNKKEKKKSFWKRMFEVKEGSKDDVKPPIECCRKHQANVPKADLDLSELGGEVFKTCGTAYLVQKDLLPVKEKVPSKEDMLVRKMEVDPEFKDTVDEDPLPHGRSAEMRLLELSDKKLHPLYRRYGTIKKRYLQDQKKKQYKTVSWPVDMHEIPARLNINTELLEKKNMFLEFKRIEPPRQLIGRIVELNRNARATLQKKQVPVDMKEVERRQLLENTKSAVFDTLYQKDTKF